MKALIPIAVLLAAVVMEQLRIQFDAGFRVKQRDDDFFVLCVDHAPLLELERLIREKLLTAAPDVKAQSTRVPQDDLAEVEADADL